MKKAAIITVALVVSLGFLLYQEATLLNINNQLTGLAGLNYNQVINQQLSIAIPITLLSLAAVIYLLAIILRNHASQNETDKFVQEARKEGHNDEKITEMLIENGWSPEKIAELLK